MIYHIKLPINWTNLKLNKFIVQPPFFPRKAWCTIMYSLQGNPTPNINNNVVYSTIGTKRDSQDERG